MRLTQKEQQAIKQTFQTFFNEGKIYLFGSRADDSRKGGDIDLYISTKDRTELVEKKINFLVGLQREIGEQKIDVVLDYGTNRLIDKRAKETGVLL